MTKPPNAKAYQRARKAIQQSREAIETLLDQTPIDDHRSSRTVVHKTVALMGPPRRPSHADRVTPGTVTVDRSRRPLAPSVIPTEPKPTVATSTAMLRAEANWGDATI